MNGWTYNRAFQRKHSIPARLKRDPLTRYSIILPSGATFTLLRSPITDDPPIPMTIKPKPQEDSYEQF